MQFCILLNLTINKRDNQLASVFSVVPFMFCNWKSNPFESLPRTEHIAEE